MVAKTMDADGALKLINSMFNSQKTVKSLWQSLADNFYPERADFVHERSLGQEMADGIMDSVPVLSRRDLGNSFHAMLRDGNWFELTTGPDAQIDRDGRLWLEWATQQQRRYMKDRAAGFDRAVKTGDHDFATFGNAALSVEPNSTATGVVYRCWHLRNMAWEEDSAGNVCTVARKWDAKLKILVDIFGYDKLPQKYQNKFDKNPYDTVTLYHLIIPSDLSNDEEMMRYKYVSYFVMPEEKTMLERKGINYQYYVIPRFQTLAGSPYAYSPATICALPDARTLQSMTYTLLEAASRYSRPPMVATMKAITGVVDLRPDGVTWVDNDYDQRTGKALEAIAQNKGGYPIGAAERGRVYETLERAFYLNTLVLPLGEKEMTAYEVQERMKQYRRTNLPLFAPMENDYNGQLCEATFDLLMMMGQLGATQDIPQSLQGAEVEFKYKSPLTTDEEEEKLNRFSQIRAELRESADLDRGVIDVIDFDTAIRDAVRGIGTPATWFRSNEDIQGIREARLAQEAAMQMAEAEAGGGQQAA